MSGHLHPTEAPQYGRLPGLINQSLPNKYDNVSPGGLYVMVERNRGGRCERWARERNRRKSQFTMKRRRCDGMHRGYDAKYGPTQTSGGEDGKGGDQSQEIWTQQSRRLVRTDSPPLHLRNPVCEPFIFSGFRLLGRYCFEEKSVKRLSAHTINSNPGGIDGKTTTIRVRGAGGT